MKLIKALPLAGVICCAVVTSGCSSVMSHTGASQGYYPGTRASADLLVDDNTSWALKPLALVDLPFSAVMDTLLLPWDYYRSDHDKSLDSPRARVLQSEKLARTQENLAQAQPMPTIQPSP
ncbi:YceK/YidQ family lipoprotein [Pantoea sp. LMR881]|uniref:YceK/YidQ family lipoprotein n=1 Tax=Pantoea sp. LMR881 TaxID=3014336 RepID=UPI0022B0704B|nr:YceK/YidQ family lipoprotein [Pantoea sp. LMR881]MCZ4059703.1 YceK/YidQ family lipoprotein [Pantoea sp. LMR881]